MKKIADIMNKNLATVDADDSFEEALKLMKEKGIGRVPVLENGKLIGVITRNDILVKTEKAPLPPVLAIWDLLITLPNNKEFREKYDKITGVTAKEIMTKEFNTIDVNADLQEAVTSIVDNEKDFFFVFDKGSLVGVLTKTDLINGIF
ncbi:Hypoxic response protein 1 [Sebaldella termitidis]|uniref:Transcriptional regulator, XRE family n=1 Tax=Sebaldella termitidis (strain ATCC 33386 / NCTC 11300) TaxID=526218 RepID=D1AH16_SEBTE|nr:CBS domain-containing protein [Sebaldella termitidis]ACZ08050.1 putative transcriptional regulator, XRE family [Sebaldella termitidis ATCC 33386]MBP7979097.1 CBS domain-containing protein [Sebaldella sp.]SUI23351.1 Hypoxic response protein 1 [Sebaldella termitidis]